jgi:multidrug transporter EmrE-like cation transporter
MEYTNICIGMNWPLVVIIGTQILFTASDLLARNFMVKQGFTLATFLSSWFFVYGAIRIVATFGQLYVFTSLELGKTMALFGAASIMFANVLGYLVLKEVLSPGAYIGVTLAVAAFVVLALK